MFTWVTELSMAIGSCFSVVCKAISPFILPEAKIESLIFHATEYTSSLCDGDLTCSDRFFKSQIFTIPSADPVAIYWLYEEKALE